MDESGPDTVIAQQASRATRMPLYYKNVALSDYDALIEQPFDLDSPYRSTVPHLAYWSEHGDRLTEVGEVLKINILQDTVLTFEHMTNPPQGDGNPSHTDLMIQTENVAVSIEAKYTEPKYEDVRQWLGQAPTENKMIVLEGWLSLINKVTEAQLTPRQVHKLTYQLIHRTAAACALEGARQRALVYHHFDPAPEMQEYYRHELQTLAQLVGPQDALNFCLITTTFDRTDVYAELQGQWDAGHRHGFAPQIRQLLHDENVADFRPCEFVPLE